jgi:hypothetical protein
VAALERTGAGIASTVYETIGPPGSVLVVRELGAFAPEVVPPGWWVTEWRRVRGLEPPLEEG